MPGKLGFSTPRERPSSRLNRVLGTATKMSDQMVEEEEARRPGPGAPGRRARAHLRVICAQQTEARVECLHVASQQLPRGICRLFFSACLESGAPGGTSHHVSSCNTGRGAQGLSGPLMSLSPKGSICTGHGASWAGVPTVSFGQESPQWVWLQGQSVGPGPQQSPLI